jgi:hypothetical protein
MYINIYIYIYIQRRIESGEEKKGLLDQLDVYTCICIPLKNTNLTSNP